MVDFMNKQELGDQEYQTIGIVRDDNYKGEVIISYEGIYVIWNILSVNVFYAIQNLKR